MEALAPAGHQHELYSRTCPSSTSRVTSLVADRWQCQATVEAQALGVTSAKACFQSDSNRCGGEPPGRGGRGREGATPTRASGCGHPGDILGTPSHRLRGHGGSVTEVSMGIPIEEKGPAQGALVTGHHSVSPHGCALGQAACGPAQLHSCLTWPSLFPCELVG